MLYEVRGHSSRYGLCGISELYAASKQKLAVDKIIYITGKLSYKDESTSLICSSILNEDELRRKLKRSKLCCKFASADREKMRIAADIAVKYRGEVPLCFYLTDIKKMIMPKLRIETDPSKELAEELFNAFGEENIGLI